MEYQGKYQSFKEYVKWNLKGRPSPPPHILKQFAIHKYRRLYRLTTFIESGTFMGEMVCAQQKYFRKIISIELSKEFYEKAKLKFIQNKNVEIICGDSGEVIREIVPRLYSPALFWLDGHYSGENTAKSNIETPIMDELEAIFRSNLDHVVLIDDARLFNGENDYPAMLALYEYSKKHQYHLASKNDIIRLTKSR